MEYRKFAVDETPFCVWGADLLKSNLDFLNSVDPSYFEYLAQIHGEALKTGEQQHAALSLRAAYSHGLETLFAFLFAAFQAPDCVAGWLLKYKTQQLYSLVKKVDSRQPFLAKVRTHPASWKALVDEVLLWFKLADQEKEKRIKQRYAETWARFADDFLSEDFGHEYNSIKHGLRVHSGGFSLAIGPEDTPGVPAPPERMRLLGKNEFGSSFLVMERIENIKQHLRLVRHSRNWNPANYVGRLNLISCSLQNIIASLKIVNGEDPSTVEFTWPLDDADFESPWADSPHEHTFTLSELIAAEDIEPFNEQEILSIYEAWVEPNPNEGAGGPPESVQPDS